MLYMLINRTHQNLSQEEYAALGKIAQAFYDNVPAGITLHGDWAANDGSCTFALLEAESPALLESTQTPFRAYVDIEVIPVSSVSGWNKR
ncbi:MAG: hypothetical protein BMS9Abin08_0535 [Gammaproteobacteria bacterium]|nr:MAG: hypothetical protein BMS9Abin08_0535 [Gammaproteobacteria bacterium]